MRQSRKEEEKTKHHAGNVKSNVIISNMKSSMKVRNEIDLSRPILPIFMAKGDSEPGMQSFRFWNNVLFEMYNVLTEVEQISPYAADSSI